MANTVSVPFGASTLALYGVGQGLQPSVNPDLTFIGPIQLSSKKKLLAPNCAHIYLYSTYLKISVLWVKKVLKLLLVEPNMDDIPIYHSLWKISPE